MNVMQAIIAVNLCLFAFAAQAQAQPEQIKLIRSDLLTLGGLIDDVLESYPVYEELPARLEEAEKFDRKANSLFADALSIEARYQTGQIGNNDNLREYEAGIEFPLWRFGQRSASRELAREMDLEADTFAALIRGELAGALRSSLWRIEFSANRVTQAEKADQVSADLLYGIMRQVDVGVLPRSDLIQAQQDKLNSEIRLSAAEIQLANAIRAYQIITGNDVIPGSIIEKRSTKTVIDDHHPALSHSIARLNRVSAEFRLQQESGSDNPALLLGYRSERAGDHPSYEDSVGIFFSYPLAFGAHANAETAAAGSRAAAVRGEHRAQRRQLEIELHDSGQFIVGAEREFYLARQKNELAQQHLAMSLSAFELGEINLMTYLMIKEVAYAAEIGATEKEIQWQSAIAQYNQAVGESP